MMRITAAKNKIRSRRERGDAPKMTLHRGRTNVGVVVAIIHILLCIRISSNSFPVYK